MDAANGLAAGFVVQAARFAGTRRRSIDAALYGPDYLARGAARSLTIPLGAGPMLRQAHPRRTGREGRCLRN